MTSDDIVARLRDYHATVLAAPPYYRELTKAAADEIERLRKERDELRREICGYSFQDARVVADLRGWDCFTKEDKE